MDKEQKNQETEKTEQKPESFFDALSKDKNSAEDLLNFISLAILIIGVLAGLYLASNAETSVNSTGQYATAGMLIIMSVIQWAFAKVFVNISKTLKDINSKLK